MGQTVAQRVIKEMEGQGFALKGVTSGTVSFRRGSNLANYLDLLGLKEENVTVRTGARRKNKRDGYELLIFVKTNSQKDTK